MNSPSFSTTSQALAQGLSRTQEFLGRSISRLSSGNRILKPSDDPQGLGTLEKLDSQSRRNQAASTNVQNAISHVQTTDSMLGTLGKALARLSELSTRAHDPLQSTNDVALYGEEFDTLLQQIRDTVGGTTAEIGGTADVSDPIGAFNGRQLFGAGTGIIVSVGIHSEETVTIPSSNLRAGAIASLITQDTGGKFNLSVDSPGGIDAISSGLNQVASARAEIGGVQGRLVLVSQTLTVEGENLGAAVSRIRDADVATETTQMTKLKLLSETGTSMLSQANSSPKAVLRLLEK